MDLFLSYARVDRPFCIRIAGTLSAHKVWYDQRLYAGQHWWSEIMRRLERCQGFIYLLSQESVKSEYCLKEYHIATKLTKVMIPVLIDDETVLPPELSELHYVDLSKGVTPEGIADLLNSIYLAERELLVHPERQPIVQSPETTRRVAPKENNSWLDNADAVFDKPAKAHDLGRYDQVVYILKRAMERGIRSRFFDLEEWLRDAEALLEHQSRTLEIRREYKSIAALVKHNATRKRGCMAFAALSAEVPDYDPDNLAGMCAGEVLTSARTPLAPPPVRQKFGLPLLEWGDIPEGMLSVGGAATGKNGASPRQKVFTEAFRISKYPVTNAQYQTFVDDPEGYDNSKWWDYSPYAKQWRFNNDKAQRSKFFGDDMPRENVTWFEAVAFCRWLSQQLGFTVTLPTRQQWQRAARGDDDRVYPWGDKFDTTLCNTVESKIRRTTMVMRYANGVSPFGIYDLSGNVWEWCLNGNDESADITSNSSRAVQGGSHISDQNRARIDFHFILRQEYRFESIGFRLVAPPR